MGKVEDMAFVLFVDNLLNIFVKQLKLPCVESIVKEDTFNWLKSNINIIFKQLTSGILFIIVLERFLFSFKEYQ